MKKIVTLVLLAGTMTATAWAGGLLHNTNQSIAWQRMMARGATNEIDGIYSNPAGMAFLDHEGWTLSLNIQSASQHRDVLATFPLFPSENHTKKYEGKASAPVIPSLYAAYKRGKWAFTGFFGFTGGGGKCNFESGLPMFDAQVMAGIYSKTGSLLASQPALKAMVGADAITPDMYNINSAMKGRQYIYGFQLGAAYQFNKHWSGFAGLRLNYFDGNYVGHVDATIGDAIRQRAMGAMATLTPEQQAAFAPTVNALSQEGGLTHIALDCNQTGWGVTPILGVNYKVAGLTLAAKYEFKTNLSIENDTKKLEATAMGQASEELEKAMQTSYGHGVNTPSDLPAVLYVAAGYEIIPKKLRAAVEYHFYDDKHAEMANDKQKALKHGTHEVLAGLEWDITKMFTISGGFQNTDYGLSDDYQTHTSFSCDSYSLGFGGAVNFTEKLRLNVGYFWTTYKDYTKSVPAGTPGYCNTTLAGKDVYSRTNKVFGIGLDYKF
ncbi:MAG: hypothetical protein IJ775_00175 [Muribaculaceae bacterium]|nr:hypothetical protein [Muribaculaceae bacterium]